MYNTHGTKLVKDLLRADVRWPCARRTRNFHAPSLQLLCPPSTSPPSTRTPPTTPHPTCYLSPNPSPTPPLSHLLPPDLPLYQQQQLRERLQQAGAVVSSFLPPASWLVLAPPSLGSNATWLRPHALVPMESKLKLSPELLHLLELTQEASSWQAVVAGTPVYLLHRDAGGSQAPFLGTPHMIHARKPESSTGNSSVGAYGGSEHRLVVAVHFPILAPAALEAAGHDPDIHHPAEAAAADWAAPLAALSRPGGCAPPDLQVDGRQLSVSACAEHMGVVAGWLAARPAVHWLEPRMATRLHNLLESSITQGVRPSSVSATGQAAHPLWAAGINGAGQVVGIGDSGINMASCYFSDSKVR